MQTAFDRDGALVAGERRAHLRAMPVSPAYRPDPVFARLGSEFADPVGPADFPAAIPRLWNARAAATVGLDTLTDPEREAHFARFQPLPGQGAPLAMRYHGHQFGSYNHELGDGRGFLFAQLREVDSSRLLDLGTKGSGQTPYSRFGDGRLTLKGGVREVLATAMLEALGVLTSRSFALYETGEELERGDEPSPTRSAVLTRLSWSHVRFGSFQRHAYHERPDLVAALIDHAVETYHPRLAAIEGAAARAPALLEAVAAATARMVATWMAAGFVHGVMNTDNMNVTGESFDYGPWRFLPHADPAFTAAYFDHTGRYAFGRQPQAAFWNLQQLGACFAAVGAESDALVSALNTYAGAYRAALGDAIRRRLGVESLGVEADLLLAQATFDALAEGGAALRWEPLFFDWFGGPAATGRALAGPRAALYAAPAALAFRERLAAHAPSDPARLSDPVFADSQPQELLIDEVEALWTPIVADDDWAPLEAKLARIDAYRRALGLDGTS